MVMSNQNFKYTAKPIDVEAFQVTQENIAAIDMIPDWIFSTKNVGAPYFTIETSSQNFEVYQGQWLVRHKSGVFQVMDDDFFSRRYVNQDGEVK
jgi:hypothetical protein